MEPPFTDSLTNLTSLDFVNPPSNCGFLQYQRVLLQKLDVTLDRVFEMAELQEVNRVDLTRDSGITGVGVLYNTPEVIAGEREHTAARMVEHGYFASAKESLGYYYASKGIFSVERSVRTSSTSGVGGTYVEPPALRITWASPSLIPRYAAGLNDKIINMPL